MNCRFLHHWRWKLVRPRERHANQHLPDDPYWHGVCIFCGAVSRRTASEPPSAGAKWYWKERWAALVAKGA